MRYKKYRQVYVSEVCKILDDLKISYSENENDIYAESTPIFLFTDWQGITSFLRVGKYFNAKKDIYIRIKKTGETYSIEEYLDSDISEEHKELTEEVIKLSKKYHPYFINEKITKKLKKEKEKYVYFILDDENGVVKIGISENVESRLASLQTANISRLKILHKQPGTIEQERRIHKMFESHKIRGEWFAYGRDIENYLKNKGAIL